MADHTIYDDIAEPSPPPEPPPLLGTDASPPGDDIFSPHSLFDTYCQPRPPSPVSALIDWSTPLHQPPQQPSTPDSIVRSTCLPRVCGLRGDSTSSIRICRLNASDEWMVDGGSNVCVTGDISALLDPVDINQVTISVALDGTSTTHKDCITKCGLLPLALPNGTTYY